VGVAGGSPDRIMCTLLDSTWTYSRPPVGGYARNNKAIVQCLLDHWSGPADTGRYSKSVQETAYIMATKALDRFPELSEIYLGTPNIHHYTYPLEQFGMSNPNIVFQATDSATTASGRIETRVKRHSARL
jgi:urate oxidase